MPPKGGGGPSKKSVDKMATKVVEDKTFGLKNKKKSKKVQAFVQSVAKQVKDNVDRHFDAAKSAEAKRAEDLRKQKAQQAQIEKEMAALLRGSIKQPKLDPGVDPKSVLCEFFKAGCCEKGDKCKYSHDLTVGRKAAKIDLYSDRRDGDAPETNADWDQAKLEEVVRSKHGAEGGGAAGGAGAAAGGAGGAAGGAGAPKATEIVCKFFLDAIEKEVYGWFWKCPNGESCKYRHALPPGYVYKSKKQRELEAAAKAAEADGGVSMEELIEEERRKLPSTGLTPVTTETFAKWKEARAARRAAEVEAQRVEEAKKTGTKGYSVLSGRALFAYDPSLFIDDADADADEYEREEEEEEEDGSGAAGGAGADGAAGGAGAGGPIDESLFAGDDADLDGLDEEDEEEDGEEGEDGEGEGEEGEGEGEEEA